MKPKTPREVIAVLEDQLRMWEHGWSRQRCNEEFGDREQWIIACLQRAIAIVRASRKRRK